MQKLQPETFSVILLTVDKSRALGFSQYADIFAAVYNLRYSIDQGGV